MAPAFKADASFNPVFLLTDTKQVIVPDDEPDPENFAKNHFLMLFGLVAPDNPTKPLQNTNLLEPGFSGTAGECTKTDE
jgi:hypothetical protein